MSKHIKEKDMETESILELETQTSSMDVEDLEYIPEDEAEENKAVFLFENLQLVSKEENLAIEVIDDKSEDDSRKVCLL